MTKTDTYELNTQTQTLTFSNTFNGSLNPYHGVIKQAEKIVFGSNYNQKIKIPSHITDITFGNNYTQPISLTSELQTLILGNNYNKPLYLKQAVKLKTLILGFDYNQPLVLTPSITKLLINIAFNHPLELTHNITDFVICSHNLKHQLVLTPNIMFLEMHSYIPSMFNKRIIHIWLNGYMGSDVLPVLNKSLVTFKVNSYRRFSINFNKYIRNFEMVDNVHQTITFNMPKQMVKLQIFMYSGKANIGKNITHLRLNTYQHINLPKHLKYLTYGFSTTNKSKSRILIPVNVKKIMFHNISIWTPKTSICSFDHNVECLELFINFYDDSKTLDDLSNSVKHLILKGCCTSTKRKFLQNLPVLKKITIR